MGGNGQQRYAIGVDVGGTKTLLLAADRDGRIAATRKMPTALSSGPESFMASLRQSMAELLQANSIDMGAIIGAGIGLPCFYNDERGTVSGSPALHWPNADIRPMLQRLFPFPVQVDNDVNMAAWGELEAGAAQGARHALIVTVGTGVGSAMILDGQVYRGADGFAGEIGYFVLIDADADADAVAMQHPDAFGSMESIASGTGIGEAAGPRYGDASALLAAAEQGDAAAQAIAARPIRYISAAIANAVSLLNPELVVLGGGVACGSAYYCKEVERQVAALTPIRTRFAVSPLGNAAGAIGGAAVAWRRNDTGGRQEERI